MQKNHFLFMTALLFSLVLFVCSTLPDSYLHIITCDVGQGDGALIIYKNNQIVIDGGLPNGKMKRCLGKYVPFWDRKIELVVISHPQLDHFGGLIEIIDSYSVEKLLTSSLENSTPEYEMLKDTVGGSDVDVINVTDVSSLRFGLLYLDVFHPNEEFIRANTNLIRKQKKIYQNTLYTVNSLGTLETQRDLNDFSIVLRVSLGDFDALFTGDIGPEVSDLVSGKISGVDYEYIKTPHHGSRNGLSENLLKAIHPEIATISVGKKNRFGHPNKEVLDMLSKYGLQVLRTDEVGDIEIVSDGKRYWMKK